MTSRERVQKAIQFETPDRPPIDMDISLFAFTALLQFLGKPVADVPYPNSAMEVLPEPAVMAELGVDIVSVKPGNLRFMQAGALDELPEMITDDWGVDRKLTAHAIGAYYEIASHPLSGANMADLDSFLWPEVAPLDTDTALRARARELFENTDLALMGRFGGPVLEIAFGLIGMEEWYVRLKEDPVFIRALLDRIGGICTARDIKGIASCGDFLHIMKVSGEDLGMQTGLLYSPAMIQDTILPPLRRRWKAVREKLDEVNPDARIMLHSCGAISSLIPDLIESGIDILDPVQPNAVGMDPEGLNTAYGSRIAFHGGIDIQRLLPFGTPEEVQTRTVEVLDGFKAVDGGFIAAPSHSVQADIPPRNLLAMIDAVKNYKKD